MRTILVLVVAFAARSAWPCSPAQLRPFTRSGPGGLTLSVGPEGSELKDAAKSRWKISENAFEVLFARDGSWVAFSPGLGDEGIVIISTAARSSPISVAIVGQLTRDEQKFLTMSSCGRLWFQGWEATDSGLIVHVNQSGQARPPEGRAPTVDFLVKPDGTVVRQTAKLQIDLVALAAKWSGPASNERAAVMERIGSQLRTPTGESQRVLLAGLVERVLATADAAPSELVVAGTVTGFLPAADREQLLPKVFANDHAVRGYLQVSGETGGSGKEAAVRLFADPKRAGPLRAQALSVITGYGRECGGPELTDGLKDADVVVRKMAADNAGRCRCTDALMTAQLASLRRELAQPSTLENDPYVHAAISGSNVLGISFCVRDAKEPERVAMLVDAFKAGLRFPEDNYSGLNLYPHLLAFAEVRAPDQVGALLDAMLASANAQKHGLGDRFALRVAQWRLMHALKTKDLAEATKQYDLLAAAAEKQDYIPVMRLDPKTFGTSWKLDGRDGNLEQFLEDIAGAVNRTRPAKPSRGRK